MSVTIKVKSTEDKSVKKYSRQVYRMLVLPKRPRKILYESIESGINEYAENHIGITYEALVEHFGSPKEMADTYIETCDYKEMHRAQKTKKHIMKALLCLGIAVVSLLFIWVIVDLQTKTSYRNGYYIISVKDAGQSASSLPDFGGNEENIQ